MHTLYRFARSLFDYLGIVLLFGAWGLIAAACSGEAGVLIVAVAFAAIFFAPAAFANKWDEIGDA